MVGGGQPPVLEYTHSPDGSARRDGGGSFSLLQGSMLNEPLDTSTWVRVHVLVDLHHGPLASRPRSQDKSARGEKIDEGPPGCRPDDAYEHICEGPILIDRV